MKSRNPTRAEREWMDAITNHGCVVCQREFGIFTETEIHHLDGKTKPGAHLKSIPLCYRHHREGEDCNGYTLDTRSRNGLNNVTEQSRNSSSPSRGSLDSATPEQWDRVSKPRALSLAP